MFMKAASRIFAALTALCLILSACNSPETQHSRAPEAQQKARTNMETGVVIESPFACNAAALDDGQRQRYAALFRQLGEARQEIRELPDGYAFRYPADAPMIQAVAEFVTYERLCCPFFAFTMEVESEGGALWLRLTGREGVKEFIRSEMNPGAHS